MKSVFLKSVSIPLELRLLRCLHPRMNISSKDTQYYVNLEKGFEGELRFATWLEANLEGEYIILCDLLLEFNGTIFQIDCLLISQKTVYLYEVKNYEGDFYIEKDSWYTNSGEEINNPILQVNRADMQLRRYLQSLGYRFSVEPNLVFINPEFTLFNAPRNQPIQLPTQLNRFMKKLNMRQGKLHEKHSNLAQLLISAHISKSPISRVPTYAFDQLQKGIPCKKCNSLETVQFVRDIVCSECGFSEKLEPAVMRCVEDLQLLFPDKRISVRIIQEWCRVIASKKAIRNILSKNLTLIHNGKYSYYVDESKINH